MRKGILFFSFMMAFSIVFADVIWCAEDNKPEKSKAPQSVIRPRPVLPPIVYSAPPGVSATPSPQIASPQITSEVINTNQNVPSGVSQPVLSNMSTKPAAVMMPAVYEPAAIQPIIGTTVGIVMSISNEEDGFYWVEINDDVFNDVIKVRINKDIPIIKQGRRAGFNEIKTGSAVSIIYNEQNGGDIASFVTVLTEEEVKLMISGKENTLHVTPENNTSR